MVRAKLCCDFGYAIQNCDKTKISTFFIDKNKRKFYSKFNGISSNISIKHLMTKKSCKLLTK